MNLNFFCRFKDVANVSGQSENFLCVMSKICLYFIIYDDLKN